MANWWEVKSRILESQGDLEESRNAMASAIEIRRQSDGAYPRFGLAKALERAGDLAKQCSDLVEAEQAFDESRSIRQELRLSVKQQTDG